MKISTKGRYGLRALLDLAVHTCDETTTLANIAERQEISVGYLEQIFSALRKAGIIIGTKGPQGGYVLGQPARKITIQSILDVLEGDLFTITEDKVDADEAAATQDAIRSLIWDKISAAGLAALEGLTLGHLVEAYEKNKNKGNYLYFI